MKITVSHNEIVMFARKALEGLGVSTGELEDAADAVGWLALHGIDAIPTFHDLLYELFAARHRRPRQLTKTTFDAYGHSCILIGPPVLDYAYAHTARHGASTLTLRNCYDPLFLTAYMIRCAQRGMNLAANWDGTQIVICAGESTPLITQQLLAGEKAVGPICSREPADVTLHLATNAPIDLSTLALPQELDSVRQEYPPAHFAAQRQHYIENGIQVDAELWANVQEIGKLVLVEATEESRQRGAGDAA